MVKYNTATFYLGRGRRPRWPLAQESDTLGLHQALNVRSPLFECGPHLVLISVVVIYFAGTATADVIEQKVANVCRDFQFSQLGLGQCRRTPCRKKSSLAPALMIALVNFLADIDPTALVAGEDKKPVPDGTLGDPLECTS